MNDLFTMANNPSKPQESPSYTQPLINEPLLVRAKPPRGLAGSVHKTFAGVANVTKLLPKGAVLAFQVLTTPFSHNDSSCHAVNKYLTMVLIAVFALACFLSSFTDSFLGPNGKLYYGFATREGLYVFNVMKWEHVERHSSGDYAKKDFSKYRVRIIDFVHAFVKLLVFLVFALSDSHILKCFLGNLSEDNKHWVNSLLMNLPLGIGLSSSFLLVLFPTTRRGIEYA